ncbi:hypothetical protein HUS23_08865 [Ectothiorhodospiraceae bacterium 2226]|nr:hypothetical protein HUS23_08865 [Ectothiorhodospiraceae bacterium 2226]
MELKVIIDEDLYTLNVPEALVQDATELFDRLDRDMDKGWQMGREWVERPGLEDRIRIVGDKLLSALAREDHDLGRLMAAYILNRAPTLDTLTLDTGGEIRNSELAFR